LFFLFIFSFSCCYICILPKLRFSGRIYSHRPCIRWVVLYRIAYWVHCPPILYSGSRIQSFLRSLPSGIACAWLHFSFSFALVSLICVPLWCIEMD
jgi:hypothetical protein